MSIDYHKLHENESVLLMLDQSKTFRSIAEFLAGLGGNLHEAFVSFPREDYVSSWQAETFATVTFYKDKQQIHHIIDEEETKKLHCCNLLKFDCLFASIPTTQICKFVELIEHISMKMSTRVIHREKEVSIENLKALFEVYIAEIASELAEEPGGELLAITIEESYPRLNNA